jgi:hypothetical protein
MMADGDDDRIVPFPGPEPVPDEERARRLKIEVDRLARLPTVEWLLYLDDTAKKYSVDKAALREMVEAVVKEIEKKAREDRGELRQQKKHAEKKQDAARREEERKVERKSREDERKEREARREAEKKERERLTALSAILKLPAGEHAVRLQQLARRLGEDLDTLQAEFEQLLADEEAAAGYEARKPWPEPVTTKELLDALMVQLQRYVIIHDEHFAVACALWVLFAWVHDIATNSPILVIQAAGPDSGKTVLTKVIAMLTSRSLVITEPTGPVLYRTVDRDHPTLFIDDADLLLPRKPDAAAIVNSSWTRGIPVPRMEHGVTRYFDPFCPKCLNGINLLPHLRPATRSRCIAGNMLPKLPGEKVIAFARAVDDPDFLTLRRKAMRWAADNMTAIKNAEPVMAADFNNRVRENYVLLFAIADLAGSAWSKRIRTAAVKLSREHNEPPPGVCLLAKFFEFFIAYGLLLTSQQVEELLAATEDETWCNYKDKGRPINRWEVAALLKPFGVRPDVIHPRGGKMTDRGYDAAWFATPFKHYLGKSLPEGKK